jgi:ABC-type multidrug transport system ATPase subunit
MDSMIELAGLTKVFGRTRAVDDLTCSVEPGMVTGFLGPNGAGKTTTMRLIIGLGHRSAATATIDGKAYRELRDPLRTVGALLDARQADPNRSARNHLRWIAAANRIPANRVDEVLDMVGLSGRWWRSRFSGTCRTSGPKSDRICRSATRSCSPAWSGSIRSMTCGGVSAARCCISRRSSR